LHGYVRFYKLFLASINRMTLIPGFQLYPLFCTLWNHWNRTPYPILKGKYTRFMVHPRPRETNAQSLSCSSLLRPFVSMMLRFFWAQVSSNFEGTPNMDKHCYHVFFRPCPSTLPLLCILDKCTTNYPRMQWPYLFLL